MTLEEAREELEILMENYHDELEELREDMPEDWDSETLESAKSELWEVDYKEDAEDIKTRIEELEEELENI